MGYAAAVAVAVAVAVALTVVPAMLGLAGERLRPKPGSRAARNAVVEPGQTHTFGARAGSPLVTKLPAVTALVVIAGLAVLALARPSELRARPARQRLAQTRARASATTYDLISRDYGPGFNTPLLVTVDIIRTTDPIGVMDDLGDDLAKFDGRRRGRRCPRRTAAPTSGMVQIIPEHGADRPGDGRPGAGDPRPARRTLEERYDITDLRVTGQTAVAIDVSDRLSGALLPFGARRGRTVPAADDDRVPLDRGADQGDARLPALRRGVVRRGGRGVRVGLARRAAQRAARRTGHLVPADPPDGRAVRTGDGLRGLPGLPDARGVRPHRRRPAGRASPASPEVPGSSRPPRPS